MRSQLMLLRRTFEEWLCIHGIDCDYDFHTPKEWARRGECSHDGAELILAFDSSLYRVINYGHDVLDELLELAEGFGYLCELGDAWNMGFYQIDNWPPLPPPTVAYNEKLTDKRWLRKRARILKRSNNECEECMTSRFIDAHHCYFDNEREPWQYPDAALLALCPQCSDERTDAERRFRLFQPFLRTNELRAAHAMLAHCTYWYDAQQLQSFLESFSRAPASEPIQRGAGIAPLTQDQYNEKRVSAKYDTLLQTLLSMLKTHSHPFDRSGLQNRRRQ